jgi:hypothetical protein
MSLLGEPLKMATTAFIETVQSGQRAAAHPVRDAASFLVAMGLPLGIFGLVNLGAEAAGILPLFFAPFGLPGWVGAVGHLAQLSFLGIAFWAVTRATADRAPLFWLGAVTAAYIFLPFITPPLDSLQLSLVCSALFLLTLAGMIRIGRVSPLATWLMTPTLAIVGFSATMGLALAAAYSPPFALIQGQQPAPAPAA